MAHFLVKLLLNKFMFVLVFVPRRHSVHASVYLLLKYHTINLELDYSRYSVKKIFRCFNGPTYVNNYQCYLML